jgi:uncharacterized Zn-finger protein
MVLANIGCISDNTRSKKVFMADHVVPHFHNDPGVPVIEIGAREFKCVGARPPNDHPHIFCDMGDDDEIICSYCSTLYRYNPELDPHAARPAECALTETRTA